MEDKDGKMREERDERVYPGAPSQVADEADAADEAARGAGRSQGVARAMLAVSLVLVLGSGAYFALRPDAAPVAQQAGSTVAAADSDDAPGDVPESDPAGRDEGAKGGASSGDDGARADGTSAGSGASDAGPQGQSGSTTGSSGSTGSSGGQTSGKPGASGGSGSSATGQGTSGQQAESPQAPATISVRVTVDSSAVNGAVSANTTVELAPGATAYDALCATGLSVDARGSAFGMYVAGIGGLAEFDHGGGSGWKYKVNGSFPNHSASVHELRDGDSVVWVYVTG